MSPSRFCLVAARGKISTSKCEESGPVGTSCVAAGVLAKCYVAGDERRFLRGKIRRSEIFFAQQLVNGTGANTAEKIAFGVDPAAFDLQRANTDKDRPWRTQRD